MTDILGPANAAFASTTRPGDTRIFAALDSWFVDCTAAGSGDGTDVDASWLNSLMANLRTLVRNSGNTAAGAPVTTLDNSDNMLLNGVLDLVQRGLYSRGVDSGAVNALSISLPHAPAELVDGMIVSVKAKSTNNGPAVLAVGTFTFPVKTRAIVALSGGEIVGGAWQDYRFDITNQCWQIATSAQAAATSPSRLWHTGSPMGGTATALTTTLTDPVTGSTAGPIYMRVPMGALSMGANATLNFGAGVMAVRVNTTGAAPVGSEAPDGYDADFSWDGGTTVVLMNPWNPAPSLAALYASQQQASAFTPNIALSDMPATNTDYVAQSVTISGAKYIEALGSVAFSNQSTTVCGFTGRLNLVGVGSAAYQGAGNMDGGFETPISCSGRWAGLNPATTYTLQLLVNKNNGAGPVYVQDPRILAYYGS